MILDLGWMVLANGSVLIAARALSRAFASGNAAVDAVLVLLFRQVLIAALVITAGIMGLLCAEWLGILAMTLAVPVLLKKPAAPEGPARRPDLGPAVLAVAALIALKVLAQVWLFAPYNYDALSYHLLKVAEWVRAEGFTREMGLDSHVSLPAGFELVETWWTVFLRHDVLIEMAGVEALLLAAVGAFGLAKHLGLSDRFAGLAGLATAACPAVQVQATGCLNDLATAAFVIASLLLIAERVAWPIVLVAVGLGIGTKPTFAYTLPGLALLAWTVRREPAAPCKGPPAERLAIGALGLALGAYWYARNAWWYGNPLHPVGMHGLSDRMGKIQLGMNPSSLGESLLALVESRIYDRAERIGPLLTGVAGWGPLVFACGTVALLAGLREDARLRRLTAAALASVACILLLTRTDPWNMRFILFLPAIFCVAVARTCEKVPRMIPIAAAGLAYALLSSLLPGEITRAEATVLWSQGWRERSVAPLVFGPIPEADAIGCFFDVRRKPYPLYGPDFSRRLVYLRAASSDELIALMEKEGLRYVFAFPHHPEGMEVLEDCQRRGALKPWRGSFFEVVPRRSP
ncbi:MAG TPA: hypothetical protein VNM14_05225 [Planctomycetota bacterium]|nr:hypothetical protein [Planctomycetota bacterium]